MVRRARRLAALELRVPREDLEPSPRRVAEISEGSARIRREQPGAGTIVRQDADDAIRPPLEELGGQAGLEAWTGRQSLSHAEPPSVGTRDLAQGRSRTSSMVAVRVVDLADPVVAASRSSGAGSGGARAGRGGASASSGCHGLAPSFTNEMSAPIPTNVKPRSRCGRNEAWS